LRQESSNAQELNTPTLGASADTHAVARQDAPPPTPTPMAAEPVTLDAPRPTPTPTAQEPVEGKACPNNPVTVGHSTDASIWEIENLNGGRHVKGIVKFRCDHKTGGGFHIRISDGAGEIDVKFWNTAADAFRENPSLCKGAVVRFSGFKVAKLTAKALDYAPPGRSHELRFDSLHEAHVEVLQGPEPKTPVAQQVLDMDLRGALAHSAGTTLKVAVSAWVVDVEDVVAQVTRDGEMDLRIVWLAPDLSPTAPRTRWSLWKDTAKTYGPKQLMRQHVRLRGLRITQFFAGRKELAGCWQHGGIEVLPR